MAALARRRLSGQMAPWPLTTSCSTPTMRAKVAGRRSINQCRKTRLAGTGTSVAGSFRAATGKAH